MIYEYALEPEVLSKPENIRYFLEQFDIHKGRLIADFPRHWTREVYRLCAAKLKNVERRRFQQLLEALSGKVLERDTPRPYVGLSWLQNAESIQNAGHDAFHAIVATENPRSHAAVLIADDVNENLPLWHVARQKKVPRHPRDLAMVAAPLIQISKQILLIDPYFDPCDPTYQASIKTMMAPLARRRTTPARVELHCALHRTSSPSFWSDCRSDLPGVIPDGLKVSVIRWNVVEDKERFHRRYILTERGGVAFEGGLDKGKEGQTTDVYILEAELRAERWEEYQETSTAYARDPLVPV